MFRQFVAVALFLSASMANAQTDERCLLSGKMAEVVTQLMIGGESEESIAASLKDYSHNPKRPKLRQKVMDESDSRIIAYVFTMRPTPAEARSTVYLKCMAGGLGHIDWSKHPEAIRAN